MSEFMNMAPTLALIIAAVLVFLILGLMIYTYFRDKTMEQIRADVYKLFLQAEHAFKTSEMGKQKMEWVIQKARSLLPSWLQMLITEEVLQSIIQSWFDEIKDLLDDGKNNDSQGGEN